MTAASVPRPDKPSGRYDPRTLEIRLGSGAARRACLAIDDGYTTTRMWQVAARTLDELSPLSLTDPGSMAPDRPFGVTMQPVRLPRPLQEPGFSRLRTPEARLGVWAAADCLLVVGPPRPPRPPVPEEGSPDVEEAPEEPVAVWGYVALNAVPGARLAWIGELAVAPEHRRRGLGHLLLDAARAWARSPVPQGGAGGLGALMVELSPRNYPGIAFFRREGFRFAGYTDYTPVGGDMRLFFLSELP